MKASVTYYFLTNSSEREREREASFLQSLIKSRSKFLSKTTAAMQQKLLRTSPEDEFESAVAATGRTVSYCI